MYQGVSKCDLYNSLCVSYFCKFPFLVNRSYSLYTIFCKILGKRIVNKLTESTVGHHFSGGVSV